MSYLASTPPTESDPMTHRKETKLEHEAFGFIRASRVSGGTGQLFDTAVRHSHYITIAIGRATQHRSFHENNVYAGKSLIEISMSESQFAQFITSMNTGSGAPCTLSRVDGKSVPPPPPDTNTRETFEQEVQQAGVALAASADSALETLTALQARGKATKGELTKALNDVQKLRQELISNMPFMMERFAEGIEKLIDRAKIDINAHAVMIGQGLSLPPSASVPALE